MSSVTIRIPRRDKERLEKLAKKAGKKKLAEAFRLALTVAEHETENNFHGNIDALAKLYDSARPIGGNVSENVDEELVKALYDETKKKEKRVHQLR